MPDLTYLASLIREKGFTCRRCGLCCHDAEGSGLVMVDPSDVRAIMASTGLAWQDIAEPYPEFLEGPNGCTYTFEWVLKRERGRCAFLDEKRCSIYGCRPLICRTYPFMLERDELRISECMGVGGDIAETEALAIAGDLIQRQLKEQEEEAQVSGHVMALQEFHGRRVVIDSEGVKPIDP